jgi:Tol biopolymer transport system component/DNA-binding CsgD family transcriptional regulator
MTTERTRRGRGRPPHPDILTPREWQVLDLLREGLSNEQIAQRLDVSLATAKYHVSEILTKLGLTSREEAAAWQPEAVAVPWWRRAIAWVPRRAWPLAGAAGALAALAAVGLAWALWQTGTDDTEGEAAAQKTGARPASASPSPAPTSSPTPTAEPVIVNQPVQQPIQPLEPGTTITEQGSYLLEVQTGRMWRAAFTGQLSPDGSRLALTQCCAPPGSLDVVDIKTGLGTRIVESGVMSAHWTPEGTQLAFRFTAIDFVTDATYIINADGTGLRRLPDGTDPNGEWSRSGAYIAYKTWPTIPEGQRQQLHIVNIETGTVTNPLPLEARDDPLYFAWSPVDDRLAYAKKDGLFYLDPATGESTTISGGPFSAGIQWSPDASKILAPAGEYVSSVVGIDFRVQNMHIFDLTGQHPPIELPPGIGHSWSPDGSLIAYQDFGCITQGWDIYTIAPDGTDITRLTASPEENKEGPHWSPDGSTLAFNTPGELTLLDVQTLEETVVATTDYTFGVGGQILHAHRNPWSTDGRFLLFGAGGAHGVCD